MNQFFIVGTPVQLAKEMVDIIKGNKAALSTSTKQKKFRNQADKMSYISRRQFIEDRLRVSFCFFTHQNENIFYFNLFLKKFVTKS